MAVRLSLFIIAALCISCSTAAAQPVATFTGGSISRDEITAYMISTGQRDIDPVRTLETSVDEELRANALWLIEHAAKRIPWEAQLAAEARDAGYVLPEADSATAANLFDKCLSGWLRLELATGIDEPTTDSLRAAYQRLGGTLNRPERWDVAYIFRHVRNNGDESTWEHEENLLEDVRERVSRGEMRFGQAAFLYSQAPSSTRNGRIGTVDTDSKYRRDFVEAVMGFEKTGLSDIVRLENGVYLFEIGAIHPARFIGFEEAMHRHDLRFLLVQNARSKALDDQLEAIAGNSEQNADQLAQYVLDTQDTVPAECQTLLRITEDRLLAYRWFDTKHARDLAPGETQVEEYYRTRSSEMREEGQFLLLRYLLPLGSRADSPDSRVERQELAIKIREAAIRGATDDGLRRRYAGSGLMIERSGWVRGSGSAEADSDLLAAEEGKLTGVHVLKEGAVFYRLLKRRTPPVRPLEEMRAYIEQNVHRLNRTKLEEDLLRRYLEEIEFEERWHEIDTNVNSPSS